MVGVALSCLMSYASVNGKTELIDRVSRTFLRAL